MSPRPETAQRHDLFVREVSILSSLVFGVSILVILCVLLTCSITRQRQAADKLRSEQQQAEMNDYGQFFLVVIYHTISMFRLFPAPGEERDPEPGL